MPVVSGATCINEHQGLIGISYKGRQKRQSKGQKPQGNATASSHKVFSKEQVKVKVEVSRFTLDFFSFVHRSVAFVENTVKRET